MRLGNHGAARSQRGSRVATGDGESQRKITCAEYSDRTHWDAPRAQVRAWQRPAAWQRGVDSDLQPAALPHQGGKHAQLSTGAATLPFNAGPR